MFDRFLMAAVAAALAIVLLSITGAQLIAHYGSRL